MSQIKCALLWSRAGCRLLVFALLLLVSTVFHACADFVRTQTIELEPGWNAVYIAVDPVATDPKELFSGTPVDIAATFFGATATRQFVDNPDANLMKELGWGVWYASERKDAFLSSVASIRGPQAYLLHAKEAGALSISGRVSIEPRVWAPNKYNLVGYALHPSAPPTFAQFFSPSPAHAGLLIHRMVNGIWTKVSQPAATAMKSGEAFWVYCAGASTYQGPLEVKTTARAGLLLNGGNDEIILHNHAPHPVTPELAHEPPAGSDLPLALVIGLVDAENGLLGSVSIPKDPGAWVQPLPPMEAGKSLAIPLSVQADAATAPNASTLLCIRTDLGTETWLPVSSFLEAAP